MNNVPTPHVARDAFEASLIRDWLSEQIATWEEVGECKARLLEEDTIDGRWPIVIWDNYCAAASPGLLAWVWVGEVHDPHRLVGMWEVPAFPHNAAHSGPIEEPPVIDWSEWPES